MFRAVPSQGCLRESPYVGTAEITAQWSLSVEERAASCKPKRKGEDMKTMPDRMASIFETTPRMTTATRSRSTKALALIALIVVAMFAASCGSSVDDAVVATEASAAETDTADDPSDSSNDAAQDDGAGAADAMSEEDAESDAADSAADDAADESADTDAESEADDDGAGSDAGAAADGESPLEALFGFGDFDDPDAMADQQRLIEAEVQSCMRNQGFEYQLPDVDTALFIGLAGGDKDLPKDEYAAQYGFGITTTFDEQLDSFTQIDESNMDPNQAAMMEMSDGERAAFEGALYGQQPDFDPESGLPIDPETGEPTDDFSIFLEGGGCYNQAQTEVFGDFSVLMGLTDEFEELEARYEADPRIAELHGEWATCMAEAGYSYETPGEMEDDIWNQFQPIQQTLWTAPDGFDELSDDQLAQLESGELSPEELGLNTGPPTLSAENELALAELQELERAVAVADVECTGDRDEEALEIRYEYERTFIEENGDALGAFGS